MSDPNTIRGQIRKGMTLAFFASAYADEAEEAGQALRGQIMDQLPPEPDPAAQRLAAQLLRELEEYYLQKIDVLWSQRSGDLDPETWGHYAAMQSMGHGVGLSIDYGVNIEIPYHEFSYPYLDNYYFLNEDEDE